MAFPDPPYRATFIDALQKAGTVWLKWFELLKRTLDVTGSVLGTVSLSGQSASIAATSITTPTLHAGAYRFSVSHRITTADNVGSSVTPFVTVTESGLTITYTGTANTSNNVNTGKSETFNVVIDAGTPVKFGATYSTTGGAPAAQFRLTGRLEVLPESI